MERVDQFDFFFVSVDNVVYRFRMLPKIATDMPATMIVVRVAPSHTIKVCKRRFWQTVLKRQETVLIFRRVLD